MASRRFGAVGMRLVVLVSISLVMVVLAEVFLRVVMPLRTADYHDAYQYDEAFGYRLKPHSHYLVLSDHLQELNTNGLGTVNYQESFLQYEVLVFALGDSYTQGTGVASDESYPFQLDLILNVDGSVYTDRYGVVNLAIAAFGMEQSMLALDDFAASIGTPDFVLFFGCSNDFSDDALFLSGYRHRHLVDGNPRYGIWLGPIRFIANETELGKRINLLRAKIQRRAIVEGDAGDAGAALQQRNVAAQEEERFDRLLAQTRAMGARLIVSWTDWEDGPGTSYTWLQEWAKRNGVGFADWHPAAHSVEAQIPQLPRINPHSAGHYRTWVYQRIARAYADEILRGAPPHPADAPE